MLNVEKYISSGIVESYVMGIADSEESKEFEQLLPNYPELTLAMRSFEYKLEKNALENAVPPPAGILNSIIKRVEGEKRYAKSGGSSSYRSTMGDDVISIQSTDNQIRVHKYWRIALIILLILSKLFLYFAIYYYLLYKNEARQRELLEQKIYQSAPYSPSGNVPQN